MKKYILCLIFIPSMLFGQHKLKVKPMDSLAVLQFAKERKWIFQQHDDMSETAPVYAPIISYDTTKKQWTIVSKRYTTTRKGKCKHTNGCTIEHTQIIIIDAINKRLIKRQINKKAYPNYE